MAAADSHVILALIDHGIAVQWWISPRGSGWQPTLTSVAVTTADAAGGSAVDLDHDGRLDVIDIRDDYTPSFATGHLLWQTVRWTGTAFVVTGCAPKTAAAPTALLYGQCPSV